MALFSGTKPGHYEILALPSVEQLGDVYLPAMSGWGAMSHLRLCPRISSKTRSYGALRAQSTGARSIQSSNIAWDHSPRPQAQQCQGHAGRESQSARFRPGKRSRLAAGEG